MPISSGRLDSGFCVVRLANERLAATFLPELGAKMISLQSLASGREFLLQPPRRSYSRAKYGANINDYDTSGFDECCPTISACTYPGGAFEGRSIPDHGDLWSMEWTWLQEDEELEFQASGKSLPYNFRRRVRLDSQAIVLSYEIESTAQKDFNFLWSAHPLLAVEPGCRIELPKEVSEMFVEWSYGERLGGFGQLCGWPAASTSSGQETDLSLLSGAAAHTADKVFTPRLRKGECTLSYPSSKEALTFQFDPAAVPYVGLWICQGGWPSPADGHFTLGIEPCTGRPDSLRAAIERAECGILSPSEKKVWELRIEIRS